MSTHPLYFVAAAGSFVTVLVAIAGYYYARRPRSTPASWEELLAKLTWIDRNNLAQVALDLVDESGHPKEEAAHLEPSQLWKLIGGLEGLEVLEKNSEVLIDLVFYVQQWYPEAIVIAERLRLDNRGRNWFLAPFKGADRMGNLKISFPHYARRAVAVYYRMTRRVLDLYEMGNFSMLSDLQKALQVQSSCHATSTLMSGDF